MAKVPMVADALVTYDDMPGRPGCVCYLAAPYYASMLRNLWMFLSATETALHATCMASVRADSVTSQLSGSQCGAGETQAPSTEWPQSRRSASTLNRKPSTWLLRS